MKILLMLTFIINIMHAQDLKLQNQIIIRDISGDVQTRNVDSSVWMPAVAGTTLQADTFIRLNTDESLAALSYPDGGLLRFIGLGSYYVDEVSGARQNAYDSKILIFTGRWFYQSHMDFPSRFIANTDVTTSVIENGAGGGFYNNGTNEFVLMNGRGLISYRQPNINAIILDPNQYIKFNIFEGFFTPLLATDNIYEQYMVVPMAFKGADFGQTATENYNKQPFKFSQNGNSSKNKTTSANQLPSQIA